MWLRDHFAPRSWFADTPRQLLRIGRIGIQHWARNRAGYGLVSEDRFGTEVATVSALKAPLAQVLAQTTPRAQTTLVMESAWLPVVLIDTGQQLLTSMQLEALVRHRLALVHAEHGTATDWHIRVDHRPGDRFALGYGLDPELGDLLQGTGPEGRWRAVLPAFAWGRGHWPAPKVQRNARGWWVWLEQDRAILSCWDADRIAAMHPALPPTSDQGALERLAAVEARRWGLPMGQPVQCAGWHSLLPSNAGSKANGGLDRRSAVPTVKASP